MTGGKTETVRKTGEGDGEKERVAEKEGPKTFHCVFCHILTLLLMHFTSGKKKRPSWCCCRFPITLHCSIMGGFFINLTLLLHV